jgi:hypothetical protein
MRIAETASGDSRIEFVIWLAAVTIQSQLG